MHFATMIRQMWNRRFYNEIPTQNKESEQIEMCETADICTTSSSSTANSQCFNGRDATYTLANGSDNMKFLIHSHICSVQEVSDFYGANVSTGLTTQQVLKYQSVFGPNELDEVQSKSLFKLFLDQFDDLLVKILLLAAFISLVLALVQQHSTYDEGLAAFVEPIVILLILIANALICVWQEMSAERSLEALKKLQPDLCRVMRDGDWFSVKTKDLVPGDIVHVKVGDRVPADVRIVKLETTSLKVEQSSLTGEPCSIAKNAVTMDKSMGDCELQAKSNILYSSTSICNGNAIAMVVSTGMHTEIGLIQRAVEEASEEDQQTPLQQKVDAFGELLSKVIGIICITVWLINFKNFSDPVHGSIIKGSVYYFKIAVALAVAAIPEGLPAVITTCLALGTRKMAQKNAIVRRLCSVETLGCTTVICSDKTGTLTTNEMCCVKLCLPQPDEQVASFQVAGRTYSPVGGLKYEGTSTYFPYIDDYSLGLHYFAMTCAVCNDAKLKYVGNGKYMRFGEPTEASLKILVEKMGCPDTELNRLYLQNADREMTNVNGPPESDETPVGSCSSTPFNSYWARKVRKLAVLEFSRDRKSMSILCKEHASGRNILLVKGAPETIINRSHQVMLPSGKTIDLTDSYKSVLMGEVGRAASNSLRTLAFAVKLEMGSLSDYYEGSQEPKHDAINDMQNFESIETGLVFLGFVGIIDPPRPGVTEAIKSCKDAGIRVIMITGDNKDTADAIALSVGIVESQSSLKNRSFTGKQLEKRTEIERVAMFKTLMDVTDGLEGIIISRTEPRHKQMVVKVLRSLGEVTAMTGDGVNDAPALKQADIGVAMGVAGTEVAKGASDMILADDNFSTIVAAVEQGRSIYNNMKAFIRYLISSNIGEVASIFITAALNIPEGLIPVQLLWVNLVTDGPPATALGFNPSDVNVMKLPPRRSEDKLIGGWVFLRYLVIGLYVGIATVGIFVSWYVYGIDDPNTRIDLRTLMSWHQCHTWSDFSVNPVFNMNPDDPCTYFTTGKVKASTLSLTVLVVIEMLNALNALSEEGSILQMPPWRNMSLVGAIFGSILVHFLILYIPVLSNLFAVVPLSLTDWRHVLLWSLPVIVIDEVLKLVMRFNRDNSALKWLSGYDAKGGNKMKTTSVAPKKSE